MPLSRAWKAVSDPYSLSRIHEPPQSTTHTHSPNEYSHDCDSFFSPPRRQFEKILRMHHFRRHLLRPIPQLARFASANSTCTPYPSSARATPTSFTLPRDQSPVHLIPGTSSATQHSHSVVRLPGEVLRPAPNTLTQKNLSTLMAEGWLGPLTPHELLQRH
jgi:hypothetical protein